MRNFAQPIFSSLAITAFVATLAIGLPAHAADDGMTPPPALHKTMSDDKAAHNVETRISSLHDRLKITADQEEQWKAVAQSMRDNEQSVHELIDERHANAKTMDAVDDLESYAKIAAAHADGLKKLIPAFKTLYDTMSDDQKKNADKVFSRYEGHGDDHGRNKAKSAK